MRCRGGGGTRQLRPVQDPALAAVAAQEWPADCGADDAADDRALRRLRRVHREGDQVGTKFNSCKKDVVGKRYLGAVQVFCFYIRCSHWSAEIVFRTDPANADYALESGAIRPSYEPWPTSVAAMRWEERSDDGNTMRALEDRCRNARHEMGVDTALEEMWSLKTRHVGVMPEQLLGSLHRRADADDDHLIVTNIMV
uniref:Uncharacterized protein n=1 Tax=Oryza punctata TaxID=4537 RepID=A0A0E0L301_ORYPU